MGSRILDRFPVVAVEGLCRTLHELFPDRGDLALGMWSKVSRLFLRLEGNQRESEPATELSFEHET